MECLVTDTTERANAREGAGASAAVISCDVVDADDSTAAEYLTAPAAPAFQFAFLYKQDLDALRADLAEGRISGADAAKRLLDSEQRPFNVPLLTGGTDTFNDEGLEAWEEEQVFSGEFRSSACPEAQEASSQRDVAAEPQDARACPTEVVAEEAPGEEDATLQEDWDPSMPSERQVIDALKVLAVPADVPVGPKAPCDELKLPVNFKRLETVLQRLNATEESIQGLRGLVHRDNGANAGEQQSEDQNSPLTCLLCFPGDMPFGDCGVPTSSMQLPADALVPLSQALQLLRPTPPQKPFTAQNFAHSAWKLLSDFCRAATQPLSLLGSHTGEGSGSGGEPGSSPAKEDTAGDAGEAEEAETSLAEADTAAKRRCAVERIFSAHRLDQCPMCSGGFRARRLMPATVAASLATEH